MTLIQTPSPFDCKRQQLFELLDVLEVIGKAKHVPTQEASKLEVPTEAVKLLVLALQILEEAFMTLWSSIDRQTLSMIRKELAVSEPRRIADDLQGLVMGVLERELYEHVALEQYVQVLQLLLAVTRIIDVVLGEHSYHLDADEFPWLRILYGQAPLDCSVQLDWLAADTRSWVMPEDTRAKIQKAVQECSWAAARDHLRKELNFVSRPVHAVRLLFALWTIESDLLDKDNEAPVHHTMEQTGLTIRFDLAEIPLEEVCDDDLLDWMGQNLELASLHVNDVAKAFTRIQKRLTSVNCPKHAVDCEDDISSNLVEIRKLIERTEHQLISAEEDNKSELL